jgi:TPP-dependent pyruvate/acetoin dehydrogenase alpha subunit
MAETADASAAYENPLIPNARLRQIYLAMLQARMLEKALPAARRGRVAAGGATGSSPAYAVGMAGLEACLVSPAADLGPGDLVSDALAGGVVDFLRGTGLRTVFKPGARGGKISARRGMQGGVADCGTAATLAAGPGITERLWAAIGAAGALKAAWAQAKSHAKSEAKVEEPAASRLGVVVVYVRAREASAATWRGALGFAAEQELPIVFVVLPPARGVESSGKASGVSAISRSYGVPGIAIDADDAVAIYRVAQESIGRARAGGGAALMECVPFVMERALSKGRPTQDAIMAMENYMLQRGVVTKRWMEREAKGFARRLAARA